MARNVRGNRQISDSRKTDIMVMLNRLLGLDERIQTQADWTSPRIAVSIALYRNRT